MAEIADLEQRIKLALDRIGSGLDGLSATPEPDTTELDAAREGLEAEKTANAQLEERVRNLRDQHDAELKELEDKVAARTAQAEASAGQVQELRRSNEHLQAALTTLREAASAGADLPEMINQAMQAELEGMKSVRDSDRAEMDEILGALAPILKETQDA